MMLASRRSFLSGLIAAPVIVAASNIMPVRSFLSLPKPGFESFDQLINADVAYQWMQDNPPGWNNVGGWRAVPASRYNRHFDIDGDIIQVGGLTLMERKRIDYENARGQEIKAAHALSGNVDAVKSKLMEWRS